METVKEIARIRDGGSLIVETQTGKRYFLDWGIGSATRGELFKSSKTELRGEKVEVHEAKQILSLIRSQIPGYNV